MHIGARIVASATPGEVRATRTVRDLVACSGLQFDARGTFEFKGVTDLWALFAAEC